MEIKAIDDILRNDITSFIKNNWGSGIMVVKGRVHNMEILPGFAAVEDNEIKGIITYCIEDGECEIVSLDSLVENKGLGTSLLEKVINMARDLNCRRVWLITTNDNTRAIRFYQKRGFDIKDIYINAVNESRKIKPEIPVSGNDDIPILHEIEFEMLLSENKEDRSSQKDLSISEMMDLSYRLWEKNKEKWSPMEPSYGRSFILYMIEEIGEVIAIIKKKGEKEIMDNPAVRERFVEEMGDVLMYYVDVLNRFKVTPEEFAGEYMKKFKSNMNRDYNKQYKEYI
jgi:GNAT superfamily N-acetyltransferase/NTP pyrophosphatase (non-canonical NTP hydrolase)